MVRIHLPPAVSLRTSVPRRRIGMTPALFRIEEGLPSIRGRRSPNLIDAGCDRSVAACFECRRRGAQAQQAPQDHKASGHPRRASAMRFGIWRNEAQYCSISARPRRNSARVSGGSSSCEACATPASPSCISRASSYKMSLRIWFFTKHHHL